MSTYPTDLHTFRELLDDIDTAINLEDALEDEGVSDLLEEYLDKWNKQVTRIHAYQRITQAIHHC